MQVHVFILTLTIHTVYIVLEYMEWEVTHRNNDPLLRDGGGRGGQQGRLRAISSRSPV